MSIPCAVVARRLWVRGFRDLTVDEACRIGPWMCFTPMLQAILFGVSTVTASGTVLRVLAALLFLGALMGRHPFDWIYDGVIRFLEESPKLPSTPPRRRAVFAVGGIWCLVTAALFSNGNMVAGYALGTAMTLSTGFLALTHICIPSRVMEWFADRSGSGKAGTQES
ncbi:MAG TPA: DUF4395 family protein [Fibrobacteria bacterium]|jgi:hypothetical protein|nr:DUF4395 family protein [Fibrobacteria bacterium]